MADRGGESSQGQRKTRRSLFSPFSAKKDNKKVKTGCDDDDDDIIVDDQRAWATDSGSTGRERKSSKVSCVDIPSIHETVMTRVNETLTSYRNAEGDFDNPIIKQLIPALATTVSVAV